MRITVGRQEIKFDDERVVGAVNWSNPGAFLDGIRWDRKADDPTQGNTTAALTWDELKQTRRIMAYHRAMVGERHRLSFLVFDQDSETEPSQRSRPDSPGPNWEPAPGGPPKPTSSNGMAEERPAWSSPTRA